MSARDYRKLFTPPAKQRRVELLHSPTPSSEEESQDADEEEDPEEPDYATEHSTTKASFATRICPLVTPMVG